MNKQGLLIVVSGPSGVGKGTVLKRIYDENPTVVPSISCTTRKPREIDVDGVTYFFKTVEEFDEMIESDEFLEWAVYGGNKYGTPKKYVEDCLSRSLDVLLEIDVQGALNLMERGIDAVYIFIAPEDREVLRKRLCGRGTETSEEIEKRLAAAEWELSQKERYDYIVINRVVSDTVDEIINILNTRRDAQC